MDTKTFNYKNIDENLHMYEHKSGLKTFVIPKKGYSKKYAVFAANYGSINSEFIVPGDSQPTRVPDGIAHFLEHKLFEQKDGNVMEKFAQLGSNPNAYTSFNLTAFLFSCTDKFHENFDLLLNFVQNPYITEESVEKEKGIIGQEIRMYDDDAGWRAFFNLLGAFYKVNPVRIDIAGTIDSISKINRDVLYKCYNTFYHPSNMVAIVVGDVDPSEVFAQVERGIGTTQTKPEIKRIFPEEGKTINKPYTEQKQAVSMPIFQLGFRDNKAGITGIECLRHEAAMKILLEMLVGKSSGLYDRLYNEGLINASFDFDYNIERSYAFSMIGGESSNPELVRDKIAEEVRRIRRDGLNRNDYERIRNAVHGRFIRQWNSVDRISHNFVSVYFKDVSIFDYFEVYDKISFEHIKDVFEQHFNLDNLALSVIKPV